MVSELCKHPFIFASNYKKSVRRYLFVGLFFLLSNLCIAQNIQIVDENSGEPIAEAIVFNEDQTKFVESNEMGMVNLDIFSVNDNLIIQHPSYHIKTLRLGSLKPGLSQILLKEKIIRIDEVIISANKWEQKQSEIPFDILALGIDEVGFNNAQTTADMLESTGQIFVQKSQLGGGSPMIRGFGANAVLLVVDGIRMNNTIFRGGNLQNIINIDPNSIESSEVIFGPGAVIYGSDALGGIMDFHTVKPKFSNDNVLNIRGHGLVRYSTANNEKTGSFQLIAGRKKWGYVGNFSYSNFDDLRTGSTRPKDYPDFGKRPEYIETINGLDSIIDNGNENLQRFSGYNQISTLQKLAVRFNGQSELSYTFNFSTTSDIPRYDRLIIYDDNDQLEYAKWYYGPQKWMMHALKFNYYRSNRLFDAMKLTAASQFFQESRHDRRYRNLSLRNRTERVNALSFNLDFEKDINSANHVFYGAEYLYNHVNSSAFQNNIGTGEIGDLSTRYPDGGSDVSVFAAYLSYKRDIKEQLFFSTGLRYNYQDLSSSFSNSTFDFNSIENRSAAFNGNIGLVYKSSQNWFFSAMLSSGFRSPNVDDISKVFDSEPGGVVVPNPNLKPEYSYNTELSMTKVFDDKVELKGSVFYSFLRDAMVRGDYQLNGEDSILYDGELSRVQAILNTGRANIYGFNLGLKVDLSLTWSATANVNLTEGKDLENNEPLRHTTPVFGMASLNYKQKKINGEFFVRFNGARTLENLPPSERNKTHIYSSDGSLAWYTLNLRGQYTLTDWLTMNAALENILDHHYRTYSSGISAPGRNFIISIKASF